MENNLSRFACILIVTTLFVGILPAFAPPSEPHAAPAMWIEPSTIDVLGLGLSFGDKFNVTVWLNMDVGTYVWQFKMLYNNAQLKALRAVYTHNAKSEFFDFAGSITIPVVPIIDHAAGFVLHGESLMGDMQRDPGEGSLCWVEFEIIASPPPMGLLESDLDITTTYPDDTYVLNPDLDTTSLTSYNAHYTYAYIAPPKPHLAVDPAYKEFLQYPPSSVGELFDINIYLMSYDGTWSLENVSTYLGFDDSLIDVVDVTFDPLWTTTTWTPTPGDVELFAGDPTTTIPSGNVLIATVTFNVTHQDEAPPRPAGDYDASPLDLHDYLLMGLYGEVQTEPEVDGVIRIYCLVTIIPPHLEVSNAILGPEPSVGEEFDVTVSIKDLDAHLYLVGVQFRLSYDPTYLEVVEPVEEGPFLPGFAALQPGSLGTFFQAFNQSNGAYGPHVLVGNMIFPNETGWWNPPWPEGEGVIATITFRLIRHDPAPPQETIIPLNIVEQLAVGLDDPETQNVADVSLDTPINGTVTIYNQLPGRMIDVYGGLECTPFPAPYGGQGPHKPMDMVWPQKEVCLYVNVTYNFWPVQNKIIGFEVEGPFDLVCGQELVPKPRYGILLKDTAITNESGVAKITFRMPWQCFNATEYFGIWKVTATVDIACTVINDTLMFHYDYLMNIWKVTTDKYKYCHCEWVNINITYGTFALQSYPILFTAVIYDELNQPIGMAFAGIATIHVNCFDKDPTVGGQAWCPEYPPPKIYIKYH